MRWSVRPCRDATASARSTGPAAALLAVALGGLLAGCGALPTSAQPAPALAPVAGADGVLHVRLDHRAGAPAGPAPVVVLPRGSTVELVVGSDVAEQVVLSGYDRTRFVTAGGTVTVRFISDRPVEVTVGSGPSRTALGRFDVR